MHWYVGELEYRETVDTLGGSEGFAWHPNAAFEEFDLIDLRRFDIQSDTSGPRHFALIHTSTFVQPPQGSDHLGSGPLDEIQLNAAEIRKLRSASRVQFTSTGLLGAMREMFIEFSDPEGLTGIKPVMPGRRGFIRSLRLRANFNDAAFASLLDRVRRDYREVRDGGSGKHRQWLAHWLDMRRIRRAAYRYFQPPDVPDEPPEDPATPITESFPGTSATYGGDLTWTEYDTGFQNVSGKAFKAGSGSGRARADTDLSSGDMYAWTARNSGNSYGWLSPTVRFSSSADTCYNGILRYADNPSDTAVIRKVITGTPTNIASHLGYTKRYAVPYENKLTVSGSDLDLLEDSVSRLTVTDTAISSSNIRAGTGGRDSGANCYATDWEADILSAPPSGPPIGGLAMMGVGK